MNFSEIELFEIAKIIKEQEKSVAETLSQRNKLTPDFFKTLENTYLFYARQEKQKKRQQRICNYIDNEETLAYLRENFADIFGTPLANLKNLSPQGVQKQWLETHTKVIAFFEELLTSTDDTLLTKDIEAIIHQEREWHKILADLAID